MTPTTLLRTAAVALGIVGALDPAWTIRRAAPRPVELRLTSDSRAAGSAAAVAQRLEALVKDEVSFASASDAIARVIVGRVPAPGPFNAPVSFVELEPSGSPNVRIASVAEPRPTIAGWRTPILAAIDGRGVAGSTSSVVLEQGGVELARAEHRWTRDDERADVTLPYVPPVEGAARVVVRVLPLEREAALDDNVADLRVIARARRLRVLVHEPRPSWAAAFARRALEMNPAFDVSAFAGASKGLAVKAGDPPAQLGGQIDHFDAVVVGAPEDLTASDVAALNRFARRRGGSVLLLPDRRPWGPYLALMRAADFDEVLVEKPMEARDAAEGGVLRATELAFPRRAAAIGTVFASTPHNGHDRPVVFGWPLGAGRVMFSGALDAWRFRDAGNEDFNRFWTAVVAGAALASPERLELSADPGVARPGETIAIRLRVRDSEIEDSAGELRVPPVAARLISLGGSETAVRLWPADEPGAFEGRITAPAAGRYDLQASSSGTKTDTIVIVADDARRPEPAGDRHEAIAAATGGVVARAADLAPLVRALRALPAPQVGHDIHPARSPWFVAAFASLLCVEWMLRRRSGLR